MTPRMALAAMERRSRLMNAENVRYGLLATLLEAPYLKKGARVTQPDEWFDREPKGPNPVRVRDQVREFRAAMKEKHGDDR